MCPDGNPSPRPIVRSSAKSGVSSTRPATSLLRASAPFPSTRASVMPRLSRPPAPCAAGFNWPSRTQKMPRESRPTTRPAWGWSATKVTNPSGGIVRRQYVGHRRSRWREGADGALRYHVQHVAAREPTPAGIRTPAFYDLHVGTSDAHERAVGHREEGLAEGVNRSHIADRPVGFGQPIEQRYEVTLTIGPCAEFNQRVGSTGHHASAGAGVDCVKSTGRGHGLPVGPVVNGQARQRADVEPAAGNRDSEELGRAQMAWRHHRHRRQTALGRTGIRLGVIRCSHRRQESQQAHCHETAQTVPFPVTGIVARSTRRPVGGSELHARAHDEQAAQDGWWGLHPIS